jgi:broad specificity phosphatase PhoE
MARRRGLSGRHPGPTDVPLTACGGDEARILRAPLAEMTITDVFTSPLQRGRRTCEPEQKECGIGAVVEERE